MKTWFLYLIECTDGSIYTGITTDVAARFAAHCRGKGARYTRAHPPLRILGVISYPDRSSASKAEYAVKQLSAQQKRRLFTSSGQIPADISAPPPAKSSQSPFLPSVPSFQTFPHSFSVETEHHKCYNQFGGIFAIFVLFCEIFPQN